MPYVLQQKRHMYINYDINRLVNVWLLKSVQKYLKVSNPALSKSKCHSKRCKAIFKCWKNMLGKSFWSWKFPLGKSLLFHASIFTPVFEHAFCSFSSIAGYFLSHTNVPSDKEGTRRVEKGSKNALQTGGPFFTITMKEVGARCLTHSISVLVVLKKYHFFVCTLLPWIRAVVRSHH